MPKARERIEEVGGMGERSGGKEEGKWKDQPREREKERRKDAIPGHASRNASKHIRTSRYWLASISCELISSITESRLAGPGLSILVRAMCESGIKKKEKKPVAQCTICAHLVKCFIALEIAMEIAKLNDGRILRCWRVTLVLIDHYAAYDWRNRQLIIHRFSYRYGYRSVQHFLTELPRLCS